MGGTVCYSDIWGVIYLIFNQVVQLYNFHTEACLKKKFVSCVAGGRNCGQSGGRNFFIFFCFFGGGQKMMKS